MFAVVGAVLLGAIFFWLFVLRPHSTYVACPFKLLRGVPNKCVADFVIIGAGAGGLAAAQRLLLWDSNATVVVLEQGEELPFSSGLLAFIARYLSKRYFLSSAPNLVGSHIDAKWHIHRPLYLCTDEAELKGANGKPFTDALQAYPRGCCVDGTAGLDWGIWVPPLSSFAKDETKEEKETDKRDWAPPLQVPVLQNPLSWAFAESAAALLAGARHIATADVPHCRNSVFSALLRTDSAGRRVPLLNCALRTEEKTEREWERRLRVATGCRVVGIDINAKGRATIVRCANACGTVEARRGVIVCAGVIGTPRLLRCALPAAFSARSIVRDVVAVPIVLQARPGISDDKQRTAKSVCDTIAAADVTRLGLGHSAELLLALVPRGGRDAALLRGLHINSVLGVFAEAVTVLVVLRGAGAGGFEVSDTGPVASKPPPRKGKEQEKEKEEQSREDHRAGIVAALADGVRLCRRIAGEPPLANLTTNLSAIDAALLPCKRRAVEYARLMHTPRAKWTPRQRKNAQELLAWAEEAAKSDEYVEQYVRRHAVWLGFGSGSSEFALDDGGKSLRVRGTTNVFVGDCSAATGGDDELRAGSVATAMAMGRAAADELLRSLTEETNIKKE